MSPAILDSEFSSISLQSYYTTPTTELKSSSTRRSHSDSGSGSAKHPHVWELSTTSTFEPAEINRPLDSPIFGLIGQEDIPNFLSNVNQALNSITMNENHYKPSSSVDSTRINTLLPPFEIQKYPMTKPNGPRSQNENYLDRPVKPIKSRLKPKASFFILDNEEELKNHDKNDDEEYLDVPTLYRSNSSRKRSIEGYAISSSDNNSNDNNGIQQIMKFRIVNPDYTPSSRSSRSTISQSPSSHDRDDLDDDISINGGRRGSIFLGSGSDISTEELGMRLAEYSMNNQYNQMKSSGQRDESFNKKGDNPGKRYSLIEKARELVSGKGRTEENASLTPEGRHNKPTDYSGSNHSPTTSYFGNWKKWRKSDRRTASEDWTNNQRNDTQKARQGSTSTSHTHPQSNIQEKKGFIRRFPTLSLDLGSNSRRKSESSENKQNNHNSEEDDWDAGLPPNGSSSIIQPQRNMERGWKGFLTSF